MHLQEIKKSTLSILDDKRCSINETESKPWNRKLYHFNRLKLSYFLKKIFYFNKFVTKNI